MGEYVHSMLVYGIFVSICAYTLIWVLNLVVNGSPNELLSSESANIALVTMLNERKED